MIGIPVKTVTIFQGQAIHLTAEEVGYIHILDVRMRGGDSLQHGSNWYCVFVE